MNIACFSRIKFRQNARDANAISNPKAMIHSPNLRKT